MRAGTIKPSLVPHPKVGSRFTAFKGIFTILLYIQEYSFADVLQNRSFPVKLAKFLRALFSTKHIP